MQDESSKVIQYQNLLATGKLVLEMNFITQPHLMPMHNLRTKFDDDLSMYSVVHLNVDKVVAHLDDEGEIRYPKGNLSIDSHTANLLDFIEKGNSIIPPAIIYVNKSLWTILDGQHRISLMRYLKLKSAPFLVRKNQLQFCENLK